MKRLLTVLCVLAGLCTSAFIAIPALGTSTEGRVLEKIRNDVAAYDGLKSLTVIYEGNTIIVTQEAVDLMYSNSQGGRSKEEIVEYIIRQTAKEKLALARGIKTNDNVALAYVESEKENMRNSDSYAEFLETLDVLGISEEEHYTKMLEIYRTQMMVNAYFAEIINENQEIPEEVLRNHLDALVDEYIAKDEIKQVNVKIDKTALKQRN